MPLDSTPAPRSMPRALGCPPGASGCAPWTPRRAPRPGASPAPGSLACAVQWLCSQVSSLLPLQGWNRGCVFINGRNLGRYWNIGPQEALYLPGSWLQPGTNEVGGPSPPFWAQTCPHPRAAHPARGSPLLPPPCLSFQIVLFEKEKSGSGVYSTDVRRWAGPGPQVGGAGS